MAVTIHKMSPDIGHYFFVEDSCCGLYPFSPRGYGPISETGEEVDRHPVASIVLLSATGVFVSVKTRLLLNWIVHPGKVNTFNYVFHSCILAWTVHSRKEVEIMLRVVWIFNLSNTDGCFTHFFTVLLYLNDLTSSRIGTLAIRPILTLFSKNIE